MVVGVLALQGDFAEHIAICKQLGVDYKEVRTLDDTSGIDRLIVPGGESTTIYSLLKDTPLHTFLCETEMPLYGTCAGAILLASRIANDTTIMPLGRIDITIERNSYGTQIDSFEAHIDIKGIEEPIPVSFIRAPRIMSTGKHVDILSLHEESPILVQQGNILAGTFHPEVTNTTAIHKYFLEL